MAGEETQKTAEAVQPDVKQEGETPADFDAWLARQDDGTKALLETHTRGLKSSLGEERAARKSLEKQLRELGKQAEAGSELQKQLTTLADAQAAAMRKNAFYESAPGDVENLRLAWLAAAEFDLVDEKGGTDWSELRKQAPQLFRKQVVPQGNAGNGAGQSGKGQPTMNELIRRAAGRGG